MEVSSTPKRLSRPAILLLIVAVNLVVLSTILPAFAWQWLGERLTVFATVFLGIFIEAAPFLLLGTLSSGAVEMIFNQDQLKRLIPTGTLPAALTGALMGLFFPVCECGVVPLARRLFCKGLPIPAGVAFLLAAPVFNPIVIFGTAAAFGWGKVLFLRLALTLGIAVSVGVVFAVERTPWAILRPTAWITAVEVELPGHDHDHDHEHQHEQAQGWRAKIQMVLLIAADEFFEMGRYLVIGAALAAAMQSLVPQSALLGVGQGPVASVVVMLLLAVVLSICSTVDAFVALGFAGTFSLGSVLAFLVFGPMVDIKSTLMFLRVFRIRAVIYLIALPLLMSLLAGLVINFYWP